MRKIMLIIGLMFLISLYPVQASLSTDNDDYFFRDSMNRADTDNVWIPDKPTHQTWEQLTGSNSYIRNNQWSINVTSATDYVRAPLNQTVSSGTIVFYWRNVIVNRRTNDASFMNVNYNSTADGGTGGRLCYINLDSSNDYQAIGNEGPELIEHMVIGQNGSFKIVANLSDNTCDFYNSSGSLKQSSGFGSDNDINYVHKHSNNVDILIDEVLVWNYDLYGINGPQEVDVTLPSILTYNCTSCNGGDTVEPFQTTDTTPTFKITTNEPALCAIADVDLNYTGMIDGDSARNCTTTGSTEHTCTLLPSDALILNETGFVYIGCKDSSGNENSTSTSGALEMSMTTGEVETEGEVALQAGIETSVIWQYSPTVYNNQQVYLRNLNNNQVLGTFDKLASYNSQRWAFNYITSIESFISGLFNLTPAFYTAEYQEMTFQAVNDSVRILINDTNN